MTNSNLETFLSQQIPNNSSLNHLSGMENPVDSNGDEWLLDLYGFHDYKNGKINTSIVIFEYWWRSICVTNLCSGSMIRSKTYFNTTEPIVFHFIIECYNYGNWLGLIPFVTVPGTEFQNSVQRRSQTGIPGLMNGSQWSDYPGFRAKFVNFITIIQWSLSWARNQVARYA